MPAGDRERHEPVAGRAAREEHARAVGAQHALHDDADREFDYTAGAEQALETIDRRGVRRMRALMDEARG